MSEKQKDRKIWLAAAVLGLALTLFLTGINTVRLKRENREIQARLDREIQQGKKLSVRLLIHRESATGQHISGSCGK